MQFLAPPLRLPLERRVSEHFGRPWTIQSATDLQDLACHPAALLSDGAAAVFVKLSDAPDGRQQFEVELNGLRLLAARAGVLTPTPVGLVSVDGRTLLVLEAVTAVARGPQQWRDIGRTLARLHQVTGDRCGLDTQGYFGVLPLDNRPLADWPTFYAERRLRPYWRLALEAGHLPLPLAAQIERVIERLPALSGPAVAPALLHGDAQQNNFISSAAGAVVIDPAVHYGHPEYDLALVDYFQPVPPDVFAGYRELLPIDPGFEERRALWRLAAYLAAVAVSGPAYLGPLTEAVHQYT